MNWPMQITAPLTILTPPHPTFNDPEKTRKAFDEVQPRGRVGTIEEVVNVFVFLASDQASYVSGANINVDGGMSIKGQQPRL